MSFPENNGPHSTSRFFEREGQQLAVKLVLVAGCSRKLHQARFDAPVFATLINLCLVVSIAA